MRTIVFLLALLFCCSGRAQAQSNVLPCSAIAGATCSAVQAPTLTGTGAPSQPCNASTNLTTAYLQTDASPGAWHYECAYNSVAGTYGWAQLLTPIGNGVTGKLTAGTIAAGTCQTVTATVPGAVAGTNTVQAEPLAIEEATAAGAALLIVKGYVLTNGTASVYVCNPTGLAAATVVAVAYKVQVW